MAKAKFSPRMRSAAQEVEQPAEEAGASTGTKQPMGALEGQSAAEQARCTPARRGLWRPLRSRFETAGYRLYERIAGLSEEHPAPLPSAAAFVARVFRPPAPRVASSITLNRPRAEVLKRLVQPGVIRRFLRDIERVEISPNEESAGIVVRSPRHEEGTRAGVVTFTPAPGERGTEVRAELPGVQPRGTLARTFAKLVAEIPKQRLRGDLRRFRQWIETGDVPTTAGQPSGREAA